MPVVDLCELLEWDSNFFGLRIARVTVDQLATNDMQCIMSWCNTNKIDCLYFLGVADDATTIRQLEDSSFRFMDVRLTFERSLLNLPSSENRSFSGTVRPCLPRDIPDLRAIARTAYRDTRFYFDPNFAPALCDALYETWIEKSCRDYADLTLVCEIEGLPMGYITCHKLDPDNGQIGLVGVKSEAQGMGIGQWLVSEAIGWFARQGLKRVTVVTQARNRQAQRLYQRCGFLTMSVQLWYHRWFVPQKIEKDNFVPDTV